MIKNPLDQLNLRLKSNSLLRQTLICYPRHHFAKAIQFFQRRVHVRRDAQAFELLVNNGHRENFMLVHQIIGDRGGVGAFDMHIANGT